MRAPWGSGPGAAAVHAGLAAVAVNRAALIRELARTDFLTIRVQYSEIAVMEAFELNEINEI